MMVDMGSQSHSRLEIGAISCRLPQHYQMRISAEKLMKKVE